MIKRSMWSGLGLILAGVIFLWATNTAGRSSRLGLLVGGVLILVGVARLVRGRRGAAPPV